MSIIPSLLRPLAVRCLAVVSLCSALVHAAPGDVDPTFVPVNFATMGQKTEQVVIQPDGKVLAARGTAGAMRVARFDHRGNLDPEFNIPTANGSIASIELLPDGRILLGGSFTTIGGMARQRIALLLPDGKVDSTFNPGANAQIRVVMALADGTFLAGGSFSQFAGETRNRVAHFTVSGELLPFAPSLDDNCHTFHQQTDGSILIGGAFTTVNGIPRKSLVRFSSAGVMDTNYTPTFPTQLASTAAVSSIHAQPDGRLLVTFWEGRNSFWSGICRLLENGTGDPTFQPTFDTLYTTIYSTILQADGKILLGGDMKIGETTYHLIRLNPNGSLDPSFALINPSRINALAPTTDGKLYVTGIFSTMGGLSRDGFARLENGDTSFTMIQPDATSVEWKPEGAYPRPRRVTFESRTGDGPWTFLGEGQRSSTVWNLTGITLPAEGSVRMRGYFPNGAGGTSIHDDYLGLGDAHPELSVRYEGGAPLAPNATVNLGTMLPGRSYTYVFQLTNTGDRKLEQIELMPPGNAASVVSIAGPPLKLAPGASAPMKITLRHQAEGPAQDGFTMHSNATANPSHLVQLTATVTNTINPVFRSPSEVVEKGSGDFASTHRFGQLSLEFAPQPGTVLTVTKDVRPYGFRFADLEDGQYVTAEFGGVLYTFVAGYAGGTYNDLTLTLLGDGVYERHLAGQLEPYHGAVMHGDGSISAQNMLRDPNGILDPVYQPTPDYFPYAMLPLPGGDLLLSNTLVGTSPHLIRQRNDGTTALNIPIDKEATRMALQPDGKMLISGGFSTVAGQLRNGFARLHADGTIDTGFAPTLDLRSRVTDMLPLVDGKILVSYSGTIPGITDPGTKVLRFNADGSWDSAFQLIAPSAFQLLEQPDGKIVVAAFSTLIDPTQNVRRYHPDGSPDATFALATNGPVRTLAMLADGKFLIGGEFTAIGGQAFGGLARILPDGSVDPTFFGTTLQGPSHIFINRRNEPHLLGSMRNVSGVSTWFGATITNPTAHSELIVHNANTVRWMRQGGAAELQWVKAELIPQGGGAPVPLGMAQRITGGWEITSPTPIINATVHLTAATTNSGLSSMIEEFVQTGAFLPEMVVTRDQQEIPTGTPYNLGHILVGAERNYLLAVENRGASTLNGLNISIEGAHASEFTLTTSEANDLPYGGRRPFRMKVRPLAPGIREARLVIHGGPRGMGPLAVIELRVDSRNVLGAAFENPSDVPVTEAVFDATPLTLGPLTLGFAPAPRTILKVVSNTGTAPITGTLTDLPSGSYITAVHNGITYTFLASYTGGDGNDLTLRLVGVGDTIPGFAPAANGSGAGLAIQPDGKVIVGGLFNTIGGVPSQRLARLHPDGRADLSFSATVGSRTDSMVIQDDGRILIGGIFSTVHGVSRPGIARLEPDGSLDTSFDLRAANSARPRVDTNRLLKLRNGKVIVGGQFTSLSGVPKQNIARLNADGSLDETFTTAITGTTPDTAVLYSMHEQPDGKLLIGGRFTTVNGVPRFGFARLNADGTLDTSLADLAIGPNPGPVPNGTETRVSAIVSQPDGKILFGGEFTTVLGQPRTRFARLNADGTLDTSFSPSANNTVSSLALQEDGRILAAGLFTQVSGQARTRVVRLGTDGSLDPEFQPEVDGTVTTLVMDRHGKVWVTGEFTTVSGLATRGISKLENNGPGLSLSIANGTTALWSAGASAPVLREVAFELSTDGGATWSPLGNATKVIGGWSLENLTLPAHGYLRAKGYGIASNRTSSEIEETLLFGRALTKIEQWRADTFGSPTNQRTGADLNDADKDGVANLMEYAFGLDPEDTASSEVPTWYHDGSQFELSFLPPPGIEGVTYGAEWSSSMNPSDWHDVPNQGTGGDQRFVVPKDAPFKFMRMKVTNMGSVPPP